MRELTKNSSYTIQVELDHKSRYYQNCYCFYCIFFYTPLIEINWVIAKLFNKLYISPVLKFCVSKNNIQPFTLHLLLSEGIVNLVNTRDC